MKYRIWNYKDPKEKEVFFRLETYAGAIKLIACDSDGCRLDQGNILAIQKDGTLLLFKTIDHTIGIQRDADGKIQLAYK